jgi:glucose-1-phosphate thymidylyltransferase
MIKNRVLLKDLDVLETRPLSRLRTIFSQRNGAYSEIERVRALNKEVDIYFYHPNKEYEKYAASIDGILPFSQQYKASEIDSWDNVIDSTHLSPFNILDSIVYKVESDFKTLEQLPNYLKLSNRVNSKIKFDIIGDKSNLLIHQSAQVFPGNIIDTSEGAIIIDEDAIITPFSYLKGPIYIGKNSKIDNAQIKGGCIIGNHVRLGGEIENSIINDFSNKHHEGFLGHSILGSWVNIGALTTTSDLKNNYSEIRIDIPDSFYPTKNTALTSISTGRIKFGSIIGDHVKIAIGTMLNTGTVLDCGSNIFGGIPSKYLQPFSWGYDGKIQYDINRFLFDCEKIFNRRNQSPSPQLVNLIEPIMKNLE